eukprot:Gb_25791 [translate_table: standard]
MGLIKSNSKSLGTSSGLSGSLITRAIADRARALFVFGDSYADTGNFYPVNRSLVSAWKHPYGVTWPGYPFGRLSSGRIQTDYISQILGVPSPVPYRLLHDRKYNIGTAQDGVNFAVAGSGVFKSYGLPKLSIQVDHLRGLIISHKYDTHYLNRSLVLVALQGNDYGAANITAVGMTPFVKSLISELKLQLRELYNLGLWNFLVSNGLSFDCMPAFVQYGDVCGSTSMDLVSTHNKFLSEALAELRELKDANFLILDLFSAFSRIVSKPSAYEIFDFSVIVIRIPQDIGIMLQYKASKYYRITAWMWGWKVIVDLYYSNRGFVEADSPCPKSLAEWLNSYHVAFQSSPPK